MSWRIFHCFESRLSADLLVSFYTFLLKRRLANYGIKQFNWYYFLFENLSSPKSNVSEMQFPKGPTFFLSGRIFGFHCGPKILVRAGSHTTRLDSLVLAADGRGSQLIGGRGRGASSGRQWNVKHDSACGLRTTLTCNQLCVWVSVRIIWIYKWRLWLRGGVYFV